MAYNSFVPEVWEEKIERDLERNYVYAVDCNRSYEGSVKSCGDTVHILGSGKPTIRSLSTYNSSGTRVSMGSGSINGPEEVNGSDITLVIDQIRYFNFQVNDVDKAQAIGGVLEALTDEANEGLACEADMYLSKVHLTLTDTSGTITSDQVTVNSVKVAEVKQTALSADNILDTLDKGQQKLYENDVNTNTEVVVVMPPCVYTLFRKAYNAKDTDNSASMANGKVAKYGNMTIKMSNNVHKNTAGDYHMQMKTKRAIAFAQPLRHIEAFRPEGAFSDAVKGFILFGAKVVRPKEIVDLNVKLSA